MAKLELENISKSFGKTLVLNNINISFESGSVHALLGQNGAGKSTLMKILTGAHKFSKGTITLDGKNYLPENPKEAMNAGVAMIYQELALALDLSVRDNIFLGIEEVKFNLLNKKEMNKKVVSALSELGASHINPNTHTKNYSISERQIIEIARAIVSGAKVIIFDEPTSSLGAKDIKELFKLISKLKEKGIIVIYISHFLEEVFEISDTISILRDGELTATKSTEKLNQDAVLKLMLGKEIGDIYPSSKRESKKDILNVINVNHANFKVKEEQVLGIAGLVGSGRTELLEGIFGLCEGKGEILIKNKKVVPTPNRSIKLGLGLLSEDRALRGLALSRTIAQNISYSRLSQRKLLSLKKEKLINKRAMYWIKKLNIKASSPTQKVSELSGGNQQKVALARLLECEPNVLLLDEPTRGVDAGSKLEIYELIDNYVRMGKAVLMTSSYIPELLGVADEISYMYRGKLSSFRNVEGLTEQEVLKKVSN